MIPPKFLKLDLSGLDLRPLQRGAAEAIAQRSTLGSIMYVLFAGIAVASAPPAHQAAWFGWPCVLALTVFALFRVVLSVRFDSLFGANPQRWWLLTGLSLLGVSIGWSIISGGILLNLGAGPSGTLVVLMTAGILFGLFKTFGHVPSLLVIGCTVIVLGGIVALIANGTSNTWAIITIALSFTAYLTMQGQIDCRSYWQRVTNQALLTQRTVELQQLKNDAQQANAAKSQILANTSHELRTPMHSILGTSELLLTSELTDDTREGVATINRSAQQLLRLLDDLLDLAQLESGKMTFDFHAFKLRELLQELEQTFKPLALRKKLNFQIATAPGLPDWVESDGLRLRQVLTNLLSNAIKFTAKGDVTLTVTTPTSSQLQIIVADTGPGISPEKLDTVFEPFMQADTSTRRNFGGTGLGLSIAKHIVDGLGGTIAIKSRPGRGTTFEVGIPFKPGTPMRSRISGLVDTSTDEQAPERRILVVDDNNSNRRMLQQQLATLGFSNCSLADSGESALRTLAQESFDLVLLDCQMPGLDGYETVKQLRHKTGPSQDTIVIAVTAHAMPGERTRCLEAGMDDFASKPLKLSGLRQLLESWLNHPAQPAAERHRSSGEQNDFSELLLIKQHDSVAFASMLDQFEVDASDRLNAIRHAVDNDANDDLMLAAHSLKGICSSFGLVSTAHHCQRLEEAIRNKMPAIVISATIGAIDNELRSGQRELQDLFSLEKPI